MRRLLSALLLTAGAILALAAPLAAQDCTGTSGSATINSTAWTATCVFAVTTPDCVDSTGTSYECFEIVGISATDTNYQSIAIFLASPPVQGQTYNLGGDSGNGAMVIGAGNFFITADAPHTGQVHVTTFDGSTLACTFSFDARGLLPGSGIMVTNGSFTSKLVPVQPRTWTDVKKLYRD